MAEIKPIPEPPGLPILGHTFGYVNSDFPLGSFMSLAEQYGQHYLGIVTYFV